ncbi:hypothetical protein K449DRAFT_403700 [Hypoxylon sp. EC38]|nr:hypothetical protein K449DRAFT_403700 [Hypoxylon sp. EC38]
MDEVDVDILDIEAGSNAGLDWNFTDADHDGSASQLRPTLEFDASSRHSSETPESHKPYHTKRPHKKSRAGCQQCKKRKVKCDEVRPTCKACRLRKEQCIYPTTATSTAVVAIPKTGGSTSALTATTTAEAVATPSSSSSSSSSSSTSSPQPYHESDPRSLVIAEPLFRPYEMTDALDMKLLWFYTTTGYRFFSIQSGRSALVDHVLQVEVVKHAFQSPFLMNCLMAESSLHLQNLNQPIPSYRAANYLSKAFKGYRDAIEAANPHDYPALIATSLLMTAVSSQMFREPDGKPLYVIDWMQVWRGIGLILDIVSPGVLQETGMAVLFYRPPVDLEKATSYIPNNLLFMVASIKPGDADEEHQQTYYDMLKYLGSLYQEMKEHGFNPILDLRIITFFTFIPKDFVPLAKEHRPRALVLLAYHLCFAKLTPDVWWMSGIADREIKQICEEVGDEWAHLLRVPQMVLKTNDKTEIAQLLINNRNWTPTEMDQYERDQNPRLKTDLGLFDNDGEEISIYQGQWKRKSSIISMSHKDTDLDELLDPFPSLLGPVANAISNSS